MPHVNVGGSEHEVTIKDLNLGLEYGCASRIDGKIHPFRGIALIEQNKQEGGRVNITVKLLAAAENGDEITLRLFPHTRTEEPTRTIILVFYGGNWYAKCGV